MTTVRGYFAASGKVVGDVLVPPVDKGVEDAAASVDDGQGDEPFALVGRAAVGEAEPPGFSVFPQDGVVAEFVLD